VITYNDLRAHLAFDPETGLFTLRNTARRWKAGTQAGCINGQGYIQIRIAGRLYYAHRLAWLYMHGTWPSEVIDHINGIKSDNRLKNLRDVSTQKNAQNFTKPNANNSTGYLGVSMRGNKFLAFRSGKYLGMTNTPEQAHLLYQAAKQLTQPA
jgi:hypothetical protein